MSRRVIDVCTGMPKLGALLAAMTVQAVLSATDAAQLTTGAGTTLPTIAEFLAETLAPLGEMTRALSMGRFALARL